MSLEFAVQYPCVLRARYAEKHLREWGRLSNLHTILTTGDRSAPGADKLKWIEESAAEVELLQSETAVCANCPACLPLEAAGEGEAVGCLGRINYPIDAAFEKTECYCDWKFIYSPRFGRPRRVVRPAPKA